MKKVISFSLYGYDQKYVFGAIKNAELAKIYFPEWVTTFYVSDSVPLPSILELKKLAENVYIKPEPGNSSGMFWRFNEATKRENARVIFRDVDSRLSFRDATAVKEWEASGKSLHVIRDHPMHNAPILGGLWGVIPVSLPGLPAKLENFSPMGYYGEDQEFLWENVYWPLKKDRFVHDEFFMREIRKNRIQAERVLFDYLGESLSEDEKIDPLLRKQIENYKNSYVTNMFLKVKSFAMKMAGR